MKPARSKAESIRFRRRNCDLVYRDKYSTIVQPVDNFSTGRIPYQVICYGGRVAGPAQCRINDHSNNASNSTTTTCQNSTGSLSS